jgi:hypothetical protein
VVPDFGNGVQGYSAKPYRDLYDRARAVVGGDASSAEVLAAMRRLPGAALSDGVGGGSGSGGGRPPAGGSASGSAGGWRGEAIRPSDAELERLADMGATRSGDRFSADEKRAALLEWTTEKYRGINGFLFGRMRRRDWIDGDVERIDEALADHVTSETFTVDRAMPLATLKVKTAGEVFGIKPGHEFGHAGYIATSVSVRGGVSLSDGRVATRILVHEGDNAAYLRGLSAHTDEDEMLLPRGRRLRFVKAKRDEETGEPVVYLELVQDD